MADKIYILFSYW